MIVKKTRKGYYVFKSIRSMGKKSSKNPKETNVHLLTGDTSGHRSIPMTTLYFPKELLGAKVRLKVEVIK